MVKAAGEQLTSRPTATAPVVDSTRDQTAQGGRLLQVKDVARIELGAQTYAQYFRVNSKPAAGIAIYQTPEANSLQVGKEVAAKVAELSRRFPEGLTYAIPYDTTIFVSDVIAHPAPAQVSPGGLVDSTNRTVPRTEARFAFAVLTTERKAA
jgi:multidrug efflux pump subunit AcrB